MAATSTRTPRVVAEEDPRASCTCSPSSRRPSMARSRLDGEPGPDGSRNSVRTNSLSEPPSSTSCVANLYCEGKGRDVNGLLRCHPRPISSAPRDTHAPRPSREGPPWRSVSGTRTPSWSSCGARPAPSTRCHPAAIAERIPFPIAPPTGSLEAGSGNTPGAFGPAWRAMQGQARWMRSDGCHLVAPMNVSWCTAGLEVITMGAWASQFCFHMLAGAGA